MRSKRGRKREERELKYGERHEGRQKDRGGGEDRDRQKLVTETQANKDTRIHIEHKETS